MKSKNKVSIKFPLRGYAGYGLTKFFNSFKSLSFLFDRIETMYMLKDINKLDIDRPIYIIGLARAGTTIILEMLDKHPDLTSHKYKHLPMLFLPHLFSQITELTKFFTKPIERVHKDGIFVTRESPKAVEEKFWQHFFNNSHNEEISNIINKTISNP